MIYMIEETYGDPYDYNEYPHGYVLTEEEAKRICDEYNKKYAEFDVEAYNKERDELEEWFYELTGGTEPTKEQYAEYNAKDIDIREKYGYNYCYDYSYYECRYYKIKPYHERNEEPESNEKTSVL